MDSFPVVIGLVLIGLTWWRWRSRSNLPPGPFPLPVVGNLLQMGTKPHESFAQLSKKYGPLMSIHMGSLYTVVVSSPELAREILQKHGQVFSGRTIAQAMQACEHDKISMAFLASGSSSCRELRKLCKEEMFSNPSLDASEGLRQEKLQQLLDYVQKCCDGGRAVDIREAAFITTLNLMSSTMFSTQATDYDSEATQEFKEVIEGVANIVGTPNLADFFPILKPFDLQGVKRKADFFFGTLLGKIEGYLNERVEWRKANPDAPKKNDLMETLVDAIQGNNYKLTIDHLTHLILDLFVGGSDTTTTIIEWTMSELMMNPDKVAKLKEELKLVLGDKYKYKHKTVVDESEMSRLPYLRAVMKEVLRLHTPGPLLVPRKAESDQEVNGYLIPKGSNVIFNAWAMHRDPTIWKNPHSFEPERFLDHDIDFKGLHFELIPFGSGRRICPGLPFANRIMHITIATLLHNFDWKLERPSTAHADNKPQLSGFMMRRAVPLRIIPIRS